MAKNFSRSYRVRQRNAWLKFAVFILAVAIVGLGVVAYKLRSEHPISVRALR